MAAMPAAETQWNQKKETTGHQWLQEDGAPKGFHLDRHLQSGGASTSSEYEHKVTMYARDDRVKYKKCPNGQQKILG